MRCSLRDVLSVAQETRRLVACDARGCVAPEGIARRPLAHRRGRSLIRRSRPTRRGGRRLEPSLVCPLFIVPFLHECRSMSSPKTKCRLEPPLLERTEVIARPKSEAPVSQELQRPGFGNLPQGLAHKIRVWKRALGSATFRSRSARPSKRETKAAGVAFSESGVVVDGAVRYASTSRSERLDLPAICTSSPLCASRSAMAEAAAEL
jgi:hypothetical protein